jgi:hypothetical protein
MSVPSVPAIHPDPRFGTAGSHGADCEREIYYEHSRRLPDLLAHLGIPLLVSTYQAGKLAVVGAREGRLALSFAWLCNSR